MLEGREIPTPPYSGVSRGTIITPETTTQRITGSSVSQRLANLNPQGKSALEQLVGQLSKTGIQVHGSGNVLQARLGADVMDIPVFDKSGRMFYGSSVYSTVGKMFAPGTGGAMQQTTLPEYIYQQALQATSTTGGKAGISPKAQFAALRDSIGSFFGTHKVFEKGASTPSTRSVGEIARVFEPYFYQGRALPGHLQHMQKRATFFFPEGSTIHGLAQQYQSALQQMSGAPAMKARLTSHGTIEGPNVDIVKLKQNMMDAREALYKAVVKEAPSGYSLLTASQSGKWVFPQSGVPEVKVGTNLIGTGAGAMLPITMTSMTSEEIVPLGSFKPGIHHRAHASYLPIPQRYTPAPIPKYGKGPADSQIYRSMSAGKSYSIIQPKSFFDQMSAMRQATGRAGTLAVPMDMLVIRDPKIREFMLGKSGAILSEWGMHALARPHEYTRKVKIAASGVDVPGLEAGEFELNTALKKRLLKEIGIQGHIKHGGVAGGLERVKGRRPFEVSVGADKIIGMHLDDEGGYGKQDMARRVVKARKAGDKIIGYKYLDKTGELEFTLAGERELRMADQLTVGEHGVRIGVSRTGPVRAVDRRGKVHSFDLMADVPIAEVTDGRLKFANVSAALPEIKGPGDLARYQLQTIASRIDVIRKRNVRKYGPVGLTLMEDFAEALDSKVQWIQPLDGRKKEPIIEGILSSKRTYGDAMDRFMANIRARVGDDKAARTIFQELTGLEVLTLSDEMIESHLVSQGHDLSDPMVRQRYEQMRGKVEAFGFRGVPIGMRDRFYNLKSGRAANIKFKMTDAKLLETALAGYSNSANRPDFHAYTQLVNRVMTEDNQSLIDDLTKMTRSFYETPKGVKITRGQGFAPLPEGLSGLHEIEVDKLRGTILVDKEGKLRTRGFNIKVSEPIQLLGEGLHRAPTMPSDTWYMPSPSSQFRIDDVTGKVILGGGPKSVVGKQQAQRAYLQITEQMQATSEGTMAASSVRGRLDAVYSTMFESAAGKSGSMRQMRISPTIGGQGRVGYLPSLEPDQLGVPSSRIRSTLGETLYKQHREYQAGTPGAKPVHMMARRHPVKGTFQLRAMEVVEVPDSVTSSAAKMGGKSGLTMPNIATEEMFYTSRPFQWLTQGDLDGDVIEAFLLTDDARGLSVEQKALARVMAQQKKTTGRIQKMLDNIEVTEEFGELASKEYQNKMASLSNQLRSVIGGVGEAGTVTDAVAATGFELASRHGALTPAGEVFFRSRAPIVDEMSSILAAGGGKQEVYATLAKWSKEERSANHSKVIREILDTAIDVGGKQAGDLYSHVRHLVGYRLLEKATHGSDLKSEAGFEFIQKIQQAGARIVEDPRLLTGGSDVDDVADMLARMAGGGQTAEESIARLQAGADVKSTRALPLAQEVAASEQNLSNLFRRMAKVTLATEAFSAGAGYSSPLDFLFRTKESALSLESDAAVQRAGGPGMQAGRLLHQTDQGYLDAMQNLAADLHEQQGVAAGSRRAAEGASYAASLDGLAPGSRVTARQTAEIGLNAAQKIAQSKFFKAGAIGIGALAGWEALKGVVSGGDPPPVSSPMSQAPLPPPPNMSRASDSTFDYNFLPQQNIARIGRVEGQKTRLNVTGRADSPVDFRNLSSVVVGNYGFQPVQNGTFRDDRSGELSRRDVDAYLRQRLTAAF